MKESKKFTFDLLENKKDDIDLVYDEINLDMSNQSEASFIKNLDKTELQTFFIAVIVQLEKKGEHEEAARLNRLYSSIGDSESDLAKKAQVLSRYEGLLD